MTKMSSLFLPSGETNFFLERYKYTPPTHALAHQLGVFFWRAMQGKINVCTCRKSAGTAKCSDSITLMMWSFSGMLPTIPLSLFWRQAGEAGGVGCSSPAHTHIHTHTHAHECEDTHVHKNMCACACIYVLHTWIYAELRRYLHKHTIGKYIYA